MSRNEPVRWMRAGFFWPPASVEAPGHFVYIGIGDLLTVTARVMLLTGRTQLSSLCLLALFASAAVADVFELKTGGRIEGQLLNPDESPRTSWLVEMPAFGQIRLAADQVTEHSTVSASDARYRELLQQMPNTADGHWRMAEWCGTAGLEQEREFHLRHAIQLDADHEAARKALGYYRGKDGWINPTETMKQRGMVRFQGSWRLPQEVALMTEAAEREEKEIHWRAQLRQWKSWLTRRREMAADAIQKIQSISDPYAAPALVELLNDDKESQQLRLLALEVLGGLEHPAATDALIFHSVHNANEVIRDRAIEWLRQRKSEVAIFSFIAALQSDNNEVIQRAGIALGRLGDSRATRPLIEALVTQHKFVVSQGSGSMNVAFGSGGSGLTAGGGGPKMAERAIQNSAVHDALVALNPGTNLGFDEESWRRWYIQTHTHLGVDLRRAD